MRGPNNSHDLPPQAQPEGARLIDFSDLGDQANPYIPQEGDVITGLYSAGAIDTLEERIAKWTNEGFYPSLQRLITREPLSNSLRPAEYPTAELRGGVGVLTEEERYKGLYIAVDIFSRGRKQGIVSCHARYRPDPRNVSNVLRKIRHHKVTDGLTEALEMVRSDSAGTARKIAAAGLRQAIHRFYLR